MDHNNSSTFGSYVVPESPHDPNQRIACSDNTTMMRVYSSGWSRANDPMNRSLCLLMIQLAGMLLVSKTLYFLLRPLRQPRVVSDFIAGMIFGIPGSEALNEIIHPAKYLLNTRTLRSYGLIFYTFLMAVKTDPAMMVQSGRRACIVGVSSVILPFAVTTLASYYLRGFLYTPILHGSFLSFLGVTLSITAFPVVGDMLAELNLLNTEIGRLGLSSSMVHSVFAWLAMAVFTAMNQRQKNHMTNSMMGLVGMMVLIVLIFGKATRWVVQRTPRGARVKDCYIVVIMVSVLGVTILSDAIGATFVQGPILLGLVIPDGPPLGSAVVEKIELVTTELLLPLFFFSLGKYMTMEAWVLVWSPMLAIVLLGFAAKMLGAVVAACYCRIPLRKAVMLGLIMNFRGVVDLLILNQLSFGQLLDWSSFMVLIFTTILSTAITVPLVSIFYEPLASNTKALGRHTIQHLSHNAEALILACVHNEDPVPAMINLLEASNSESTSTMCAYVLHLVELTGRTSSAFIAHKNRKGFINPSRMDKLLNAFINFEQEKQGMVSVQPFTALAPYKSMHQDICGLAVEKKVVFILLPYPRKNGAAGNTPADHAMRSIVPKILDTAPCSVGILVHLGHGSPMLSYGKLRYDIGLLFWGGNDDREALAYASRMARHPSVHLKVTRIISEMDMRDETERRLDDQMVEDFKISQCRHDKVMFKADVSRDMEQTILLIKSLCIGHDLLIIGRKQGPDFYLSEELDKWTEYPELGVVGDMLTSSDFNCSSSILIVQQQHQDR